MPDDLIFSDPALRRQDISCSIRVTRPDRKQRLLEDIDQEIEYAREDDEEDEVEALTEKRARIESMGAIRELQVELVVPDAVFERLEGDTDLQAELYAALHDVVEADVGEELALLHLRDVKVVPQNRSSFARDPVPTGAASASADATLQRFPLAALKAQFEATLG